jgi:hypothetical protein
MRSFTYPTICFKLSEREKGRMGGNEILRPKIARQ